MTYPVRYMAVIENSSLFKKESYHVLSTMYLDGAINPVCKCNNIIDAIKIANLLNVNEGYMVRPIGSEEEALDSATHRHYKGGLYRLIGYGSHTETGESMVLYEHLWPHKRAFWVRPKEIWDSLVKETGEVRFNPIVPIVKGIWSDDNV